MQNSFLNGSLDEMNYGDSGHHIHIKNNDVSNDIIGNFENKLTRGKKSIRIGIEKFAIEEKRA